MPKTPFFAEHEKLGAAMADFHGWQLPLHYSSPIAEHNAVRQQCGLFDVSHMGTIQVEGPESERLLQKLLARDIAGMKPGKMRLAVMCNAEGGILDDLTVYKFGKEKFWLVVNAVPYENDLGWVKENAEGMDAGVSGLRPAKAKLDLQGPKAIEALQELTESRLGEMGYYDFVETRVDGVECVLSRSGYTGEDGFELYFDAGKALEMWNALLEAGRGFGLVPCGLAARDSLRLEAGMLLYGQDIGKSRTVLQCPYERLVSWEKDFVGKKALVKQKGQGIKERLAGFELVERGIARKGCRILSKGREIGFVTSAGFSPTLKKSIGLGYIPSEFAGLGQELWVDIRGKQTKAAVVKLPFYKR